MTRQYENGANLVWISNTGRERHVRVRTTLKTHSPPTNIVEVVDGLPGETGQCHAVPSHNLVAR